MKMHDHLVNLIAAARRADHAESEPLKVRAKTILRWAERDRMLCERIRELEARLSTYPPHQTNNYYSSPSSSPDYFTPALSASIAAAIITSSFD